MQGDIQRRLLEIMRAKRLDQEQVAEAIGISQPTVSRLLRRDYVRRSKCRSKLENYVLKSESKLNKLNDLPPEISNALARVWNRTDAHAHLIANVIRALEGFVPNSNLKEDARENSKH